jgi:hypothetical protein
MGGEISTVAAAGSSMRPAAGFADDAALFAAVVVTAVERASLCTGADRVASGAADSAPGTCSGAGFRKWRADAVCDVTGRSRASDATGSVANASTGIGSRRVWDVTGTGNADAWTGVSAAAARWAVPDASGTTGMGEGDEVL